MDCAHAPFAEEVADLDFLPVFLDVGVDGKVCIHQPHLILEAVHDALDQVLRAAQTCAEQHWQHYEFAPRTMVFEGET